MAYDCKPLAPLSTLVSEFVYLMCGARGETHKALMKGLPGARFIGFEPDRAEYERLCRDAGAAYSYHHLAVGGRDERRTLYVTRDPACSSLLRPNAAFFSRFLDCGPAVEVLEEKTIETVALQSFLPRMGISNVDYMELDTQGSELEILQGAESFLRAGVVGVRVEVEFSPIYLDQPLFTDVDHYLRKFGFMLFDLSRSRYRRSTLPARVLTRGQLLWGDAVYLRDYAWFAARSDKISLGKLCLAAAQLEFHDYALETLDFLLGGGAGPLTPEENGALAQARDRYLADLKEGTRWLDAIHWLEAAGLKRGLTTVGKLATKFAHRLIRDKSMTSFSWVD